MFLFQETFTYCYKIDNIFIFISPGQIFIPIPEKWRIRFAEKYLVFLVIQSLSNYFCTTVNGVFVVLAGV